MSRSKKKPWVSITCIGDKAGIMKEWKKSVHKKMRRIPVDRDVLPSKKEVQRYAAPDDGTQYWDNPKANRK